MHKRIALLAGVAALVVGAAPAAHAESLPFYLHYEIGEQRAEAGSESSRATDFLGVCMNDLERELCTGYSITLDTRSAAAGTSSGDVTLDGHVCVMDSSPRCGNGIPFTGIKVTERTLDVPEAYVEGSPVQVTLCEWHLAPREEPTTCSVRELPLDKLEGIDTGNLAEAVPSSLGV